MEGGKPSGSSFTSDLFGAKGSSAAAPSSEILGSIFPPPARVSGRESLHLSETEKKNDTVTQPSSAKKVVSGEQEQSWSTKEKSSYFQEEKAQPFHYSSSIYYGGQDVYAQPRSPQNTGATTFNKDMKEDDSGSASRGNWWQGSLYY